jgi:hypothetical protein
MKTVWLWLSINRKFIFCFGLKKTGKPTLKSAKPKIDALMACILTCLLQTAIE